MIFESFADAQWSLLIIAFVLSAFMGAVVTKTNFCTMGAVSDWINIGDMGRMKAWFLAGTVAMIGVIIFESTGLFQLESTLPPYRGSEFQWGRYLLGGILFGIGMTFASGCGNKTLIRIGGGNIKSIFVFAIIGVIAYFMVDPYKEILPANWYALYFQPWLGAASISLTTDQDLGSIIGKWFGMTGTSMRLVVGSLIAVVMLFIIFRTADFRKSYDNILAGVVIGFVVVAAWYFTSNISVATDEGSANLVSFYSEWDMVMDSDEGKPKNGSTNLQATSFTFISPIGQSYGYIKSGFNATFLTFGIMSVIGVIFGAFLWSIITRAFRIEWFASIKDFVMHVFGATLMGFGGVLGLGCTIGQGITGVSTLAIGSFLTLGGIILGSAMTMKMQYYKMVYEEEATFGKIFITSLADLKLVPNSLRKLDAV
ncbi:MAG: YeeE/YedE family protein [Gammaproteobacteria bacterium]